MKLIRGYEQLFASKNMYYKCTRLFATLNMTQLYLRPIRISIQ